MSPYDVLQVSPMATEEEIRLAYKAMAKKWHPDRKLDDQETATRKFKEINSAYRAILHERRRAEKKQSSSAPSSSKPSPSRESPNSSSPSKTLRDNGRQSSSSKTIKADYKDDTTLTHSHKGHENAEGTHKRHRGSARNEDEDSLAKMTTARPSSQSYTSTPSSSSSIPLPSLSSFSSRPSSSSSSSRSSSRSRASRHKSDEDFDKHSATSSRTSVATDSTDDLPKHDVKGNKEQHPHVSGVTISSAFTSCTSSETSTCDDDIPEIALPDVLDVEHCDADSASPSTSSLDKRSSTISSEDGGRKKVSKPSHVKDPSKMIKEDGEHNEQTLIPEFDSPLARSIGVTKQWTYTIQLTLMQLFRGKKLRFKIVRCKLDGKRKSVTLDVNISPGTLHGTQIIFKGAGHEMKNGTRQDIIFIVEEVKHERFVRMNEDLALDVRLPWVESLKKEVGTVHVKSLDGKEFKFEVDFKTDGNVTGTTRIPDAGMPIPKTKKRGDLLVRWEIYMPPAPSRWETFKQALHL